MSAPDDALLAEADELAGLPPDEFTAARNARAKQVRTDDRELARRIGELRKPSAAAWLVNQIVRHRPDRVDELLALGAELRAAQADLDARELTRLARERRALVQAVAREAGALADELGHPVREGVLGEVAETLQAGMTDASAEAAVRSGRLIRALEAIGTDVDLDGALMAGEAASLARPVPESDAASDRAEHLVAERRRAEAEAEVAERQADEASDRLEAARAETERARRARDDLTARLEQLEAELDRAERDLHEAERGIRPLEREAASARRRAEAARAALDD
ncbi:transposase [Agromyces intestinalis]|uniref:Transposase n=1 Tax=Agromyces intestinalis TaxID=2592652 RepID=A0A5C1YEF8_9MICO|nr:transposase [Agromyces intestinalis]QEO14463.1 transposase [Agromyces intestinalis]